MAVALLISIIKYLSRELQTGEVRGLDFKGKNNLIKFFNTLMTHKP